MINIGQNLAESLGRPDWTYYDLPQMSPEYFDQLVDIIRPENLTFITFAEQTKDGKTWKRGQILISPEGMDNIRAYSNSKTDS